MTTTESTTEKRGANGRFLPGNPGGGRPRGLAQLVRQQTREGEEVVAFMLRVLRGEVVRWPRSRNKRLQQRPTFQQRLEAAQWLADRAWGKAPQVLEATVDVDASVGHYEAVAAHVAEADVERLVAALLGPGEEEG